MIKTTQMITIFFDIFTNNITDCTLKGLEVLGFSKNMLSGYKMRNYMDFFMIFRSQIFSTKVTVETKRI